MQNLFKAGPQPEVLDKAFFDSVTQVAEVPNIVFFQIVSMVLFFEGPLKNKQVEPNNLRDYVSSTSGFFQEVCEQILKEIQKQPSFEPWKIKI